MQHRATIMADDNAIVDAIRDRQLAIRLELDRRLISLKVVASASGIPYATLLSYFPANEKQKPHALPVAALFRLIPVLPADLIGYLMPDGFAVVRVPEGIDHDELAAAAIAYAAEHARARHPASPGGVEVVDCERVDLNVTALRMGVAA